MRESLQGHVSRASSCANVPDRQDAASLGEVGLVLHTADALLEDGGNLGRGGLVGIGACLYRSDGGGGGSNLEWVKKRYVSLRGSWTWSDVVLCCIVFATVVVVALLSPLHLQVQRRTPAPDPDRNQLQLSANRKTSQHQGSSKRALAPGAKTLAKLNCA